MVEKTWKQDLITFAILFLSCSFVVENDIISSTVTIAAWGVVALLLMKVKLRIDLQSTILVVVMLIMMWGSVALNEPERYFKYLCVTFAIFVAWLYVQEFSIKEFIESFCRVMLLLTVISLICYFAYLLFPQLNNMFVKFGKNGVRYSCLYVYVKSNLSIRNCGMFWEPGAFQTFLCLALMFETLFWKNAKKIIIYALGIVTTFSTTGYITMALILAIYILQNGGMKKSQKIIMICVGIMLGVFFLNADSIIGKYSGYNVFSKLTDLGKLRSSTFDGAATTTSVRFYSVVKPIEVFFHNPILGVGYDRLNEILFDYTLGMNTCTFVNYFALFGLVFGSISVYGFIRFAQKTGCTVFQKAEVLLILFLTTMSENYALMSSIYLFCFFGLEKHGLSRRKEELSEKYRRHKFM